MSHAAFLRSIIASPDDDLPRLVYADFLDEHGDPARAEFIRVQCELAKLSDHDPHFRTLEDREHELLSEHEAGWLGGLPTHATEWEWKRGLVADVTLGLEQHPNWDEATAGQAVTRLTVALHHPEYTYLWDLPDWDRFQFLPDIQQLDFSHVRPPAIGDTVIEEFVRRPALTGLMGLNLAGVYRLDWADGLLATSPHTSRLRHLTLSDPQVIFHDEPDDAGSLVPARFNLALRRNRLDTLSMHGCRLCGNDIRDLLCTDWAGSLTSFDISDNPIAPDAYTAFRQAHRSLRLDKLDVSGTPLAGISLEPLLHAPSLEALTKLEMNGCGSARRNLEVLARSPFWGQATELRAHSGTIPASTFEPLAQSQGPPALRLLDLADNYLRTDGVRMLCDAPWAGSLTWLALSGNYLDDEACAVLAESGRFTNLRTLHLAHNNVRQDRGDGEQITDRGVRALASHPSLANLRLLTLSNTGITHRGVEAAVNAPHWRLFGLGVAGNDLSPEVVRILAESPRLARFVWLDLADNPRLRGQALRPLAESPYLSRMCELDCGGLDLAQDVQQIFRERLGPRFSH